MRLLCLAAAALHASAVSTLLSTSLPGQYNITIPSTGCGSIFVSLTGGGGGGGVGTGGNGATVSATFAALPNENFTVYVAAGGGARPQSAYAPGTAYWAGGGGGASAMIAETGADISVVAAGGGGGATGGSFASQGNGSDGGLPSARLARWNGGPQSADTGALASPWGPGLCSGGYCGQQQGSTPSQNTAVSDGGRPDFDYAQNGGAGGTGYSNFPVLPVQPLPAFGWAAGGPEGFCDLSAGFGGGGGGGGGLFGGSGGSDAATTGYPGKGGSSFAFVPTANFSAARNGGAPYTPGGSGSALLQCLGDAPPAATFSANYSTPGIYVWTPPDESDCTVFSVTASGGGGGGGWGAGGAGATVSTLQFVPPGTSVRIIVGGGGAGGGLGAGGAALNFSAGSGGAASAVLLVDQYEPVVVAAGGGGGASNGLSKAQPCRGGDGGKPAASPAPCGGATGGNPFGVPGQRAPSSLSFTGYDAGGQGGGPGFAWTGQNAPSPGYGAGGAGGIDAGNSATPSSALSPPRVLGASTHSLGNQWGGGGGGGGGYYGGGGGSSSGFGGTPGAGGASYFPDGNSYSVFSSAANGGLPGLAGGDGSVSIACVANPPPSPSITPPPPKPAPAAAGASIPIVAIAAGVGVPLGLILLVCAAAMVWAGGPRALAAKMAGDTFLAPVDGTTRAARRAAAAGVDLVSVAMTRDEALALGVMTLAAVGSRRSIRPGGGGGGGAGTPSQPSKGKEKTVKQLAEEAAAREIEAARAAAKAAKAGSTEVRSSFAPGGIRKAPPPPPGGDPA